MAVMRSSPPPLLLEGLDGLVTPAPTLPSLSILASRKRRFSFADALSSDPVFSDDLSDAELVADSQRRKKKSIKCAWWELCPRKLTTDASQHATTKKGPIQRGFDSGVWMGSDDVNDDPHLVEETFEDEHNDGGGFGSDPLDFAASRIQHCLDEGNEIIDLSSFWLQDIDYAVLRPLEHLVPRSPTDRSRPPSEREYKPLTPRLQLYLAGNSLRTLPPEMLRLPIAVLSLRNNLLSELPYNIDRLESLTELNVAGNQLPYLPWALHEWFSTVSEPPRTLLIRPNPFLSISSLEKEDYCSMECALGMLLNQRTTSPSPELVHLVSSCVTTFDVSGRYSTPVLARADNRFAPSLYEEKDMNAHIDTDITTPSLFELTLRKAQISQLPSDVSKLLPDASPPAVTEALQKAAKNQYGGNERCSNCNCPMIVPRAEWVEYFFYGMPNNGLTDDSVVPFLRRSCSDRCATPTPSILLRMRKAVSTQRNQG